MNQLTDAIIHAYVDGTLAREQRVEVEAYLAVHPEALQQVRAYRQQNQTLHEMFDHYLAAPLPDRMAELADEILAGDERRRLVVNWRFTAMAVAACLALFAAGSWYALTIGKDKALPQIAAVSAPAPAPVERQSQVAVASADMISADPTFGDFSAPDLTVQGFSLIGDRMISVADVPTAQLVYENTKGARVALYISDSDSENARQSALLTSHSDGPAVLLWQIDHTVYSLIGPLDEQSLISIASVVSHVEPEQIVAAVLPAAAIAAPSGTADSSPDAGSPVRSESSSPQNDRATGDLPAAVINDDQGPVRDPATAPAVEKTLQESRRIIDADFDSLFATIEDQSPLHTA